MFVAWRRGLRVDVKPRVQDGPILYPVVAHEQRADKSSEGGKDEVRVVHGVEPENPTSKSENYTG
jgi:hypothetical protein